MSTYTTFVMLIFCLQSKIIKWRLYELHDYFPIYLHSHKPLQLIWCLTLRKVRNIGTSMLNTIFSLYRRQMQRRLHRYFVISAIQII